MSDQDRYIREAAAEQRRIVAEAMQQWMTIRFAAGHHDYMDKLAMRQLKVVVGRALASHGAWRDVTVAIARTAARPADRRGYVYALEDEIGTVAQERRNRERSQIEDVVREQTRAQHDAQADADMAALRARHPGMSVKAALAAEGLGF